MARNFDSIGRESSFGRIEEDLRTSNVELWLWRILVGFVKGKKFASHEVGTPSKVTWDLDGEEAFILDEFLGAPLRGLFVVAFVPDLEPLHMQRSVSWQTRSQGIAYITRDALSLHVDSTWALVTWVN